jgi:hypothetical protein
MNIYLVNLLDHTIIVRAGSYEEVPLLLVAAGYKYPEAAEIQRILIGDSVEEI